MKGGWGNGPVCLLQIVNIVVSIRTREKCAMNFHLQHLNWLLNWQIKTIRHSKPLKGSQRMGVKLPGNFVGQKDLLMLILTISYA